jgi:acyl transferase domain-containing protein/thioesterase domain-containing protein
MSGLTGRLSKMSPIKLALAASELRARTAVVNAEPLAIIGLGCRFPGQADSPQSFWRLLREGLDGTCEVPAERWDVDAFYDPVPHTPGKMISRRGGFVENLREFDAEFFGISPREAITLDPQQRTLLEVAWETFEDAGIPPGDLAGSSTGVFVGISGIDYFMHLQSCNHEIDAYLGTGNALSVASGRLSYVFGLQGPCMSVDTACSSSLVAVHLACQSLRRGECDVALAGGTHRIILPHGSIGLSQAHLLAPDGRCKTFDASADGYVRGEGCGVVLLKRLSDAIADGDRIVALIRGSAVNQDGRTSGLTVPNGPAQQAVIRKALDDAAVDANQIGYVEAHGTGTPLGDPIEVAALAGVLGRRRAAPEPLMIGSVKTNVGHLEAAAGIAGLVKVALALQHREIPPHLHFRSPNPHIPWQSLPIRVVADRTPWPLIDGRRIGGVSSFSFSGTNAHAVLEEAPEELSGRDRPSASVVLTPHLLTLSARTPRALRDLAARYQEYFRRCDGDSLEAVCYTSSRGRTHFSQRLSILADDAESAGRSLSDWIAGTTCPLVFEGRRTKAPRIGFFFGRRLPVADAVREQLYERHAHIRRALDRTGGVWRSECREAGVFAIEVASAEMWRNLGIDPGVVAGQGVGELAAACCAGVLTFEAGLQLLLAWYRSKDAAGRDENVQSVAGSLEYSRPRMALLSAVTGKRINEEISNAGYWIQRLHEMDGSLSRTSPEKHDCDAVVEMSPGEPGILSAPVTVSAWSSDGLEWQPPAHGLAMLYACGASPNWDAFYGDRVPRRVVVPTYPFQRERFWVEGAGKPAPGGEHAAEAAPPQRVKGGAERLDKGTLLEASETERRRMLERYVSEQLADILKRPQELIDTHEPLQSIGMDSLMATELKYRIETDLAIALDIRSVEPGYSLTSLIDDVLSTLTVSLSGARAPSISLTRNGDGVPVMSRLAAHEEGTRVPLFFIHPGGIDISTYVLLAEHLAPGQPLYVLHPHGLYGNDFDGEGGVSTTIGHAASLCISEMVRVRPHGPYSLAGWSMGGLVAYEISRRLKASGETVAILGLLDVTCGPARDGSTLVAWFADLVEARTGRTLGYSFEELLKLDADRQIESIWARAVAVEAVHPAMPLDEFRGLFHRYRDALMASSHHASDFKLASELCADRIVFFNCAELATPERRAVETLFEWTADSTPGIETHTIPGNHYTMLFEPAIRSLAASLQGCLDAVEVSGDPEALVAEQIGSVGPASG